jgi:hypothetical protein
MKARFDGQVIFDEEGLSIQVDSERREYVERAVAGLDGLLSIDLGERGRQIKQAGVLRAGSEAALRKKISTISAYVDGQAHTLILDSGEQYENLRMDSFKVKAKAASGNGVCCEYEIRYTQLRG